MYIFAQPNYYQGRTIDLSAWFISFKDFKDSNNLGNLFMEMECDGGVQTGGCVDDESSEGCIQRACEYVQYAKNFPHRAYYYGTDITNLNIMENYCRRNCKNYNCGGVNGYVF